MTKSDFDPSHFTPYLLSMAAERASRGFQPIYKTAYGMLRTEWRVLFHLGTYGDMTARDICHRSQLEKTKVSRAVVALRSKGMLIGVEATSDRRQTILKLTPTGCEAFLELSKQAQAYDTTLMRTFSPDEVETLHGLLHRLAVAEPDMGAGNAE